MNLEVALGIFCRPGNQGANGQVPVLARRIIVSVHPTNLTQRLLGAILLHVVHPETQAEPVAALLDKDGDGLGVLKAGERGNAPVGPAVTGYGADLLGSIVELQTGLDPPPLAAREGVECEDETALVVLL